MRHLCNFANRLFFRNFVFLFFASAALWANAQSTAPIPDLYKTGFDTISAEQAKQWLSILAGPKFGGRGTGQKGYTLAAHWVAGKLAEFGLEPMGDGGTYFQMLPMTRLSLDEEQSSITATGNLKVEVKGNLSIDQFSDQNEIAGKVVFLTFAGKDAQLPSTVELRDKIVIYSADAEAIRTAPRLVAGGGPVAALRIVEQVTAGSSQLLRDDAKTKSTSVSGVISRIAANQIVEGLGGKTAWLDEKQATQSHSTERTLKLRLRTRRISAAAPNVIGWLEGSDPELKNEYIVIGSHLDHLGFRGEAMYPGADDNGSGSTAVLNIARALSENPTRPKRSVLFMWFAAEEMGLVGSKFYCDNPLLPLDKMVCMFNIDMVGRNEEKAGETAEQNVNTIHLIGSKQGDPALHDVIMKANEVVNFEFEYDEEGVFGRSDQANFYAKGTSVAFLFGGFHPDYHQPSDKPEKINFEKIARAARLYYLSIYYAADHGPFKLPSK